MNKSDFIFPNNYTFDVFIDIKPRFKPRLIDLNAWMEPAYDENCILFTESLLFDWN